MYNRLKERMSTVITRPRPLKPQTERHIHEHLGDARTGWQAFFDVAADRLEEYEIDMLFGPLFTPSLDELAWMSDVLLTASPSDQDRQRLVDDLAGMDLRTEIQLPDGKTAALPLHAVLIDRYVRLQRLGHAPDPATAAVLCGAVPHEVRDHVLAIARHRAFATTERQQWLARFLAHAAESRTITVDDLVVLAEFMGSQRDLAPEAVASAVTDTVQSARTALSAAQRGHTYLSSDVAEHHHYRGQGVVDRQRVTDRQREVERLEQIQADLRAFLGVVPQTPNATPQSP